MFNRNDLRHSSEECNRNRNRMHIRSPNRHAGRVALVIALAFGAGAAIVMACGPDFPLQLLDDRSGTLKATPANSFAFEVAHLVEVKDGLKANESGIAESQADAGTTPVAGSGAVDASGMTSAQRATELAMRKLDDGDAAFALGAGLPMAVRLYAAGAVDYRAAQAGAAQAAQQGDAATGASGPVAATQTAAPDADPSMVAAMPAAPRNAALAARARRRFQAVLDLPPADGKSRAVRAAYMLGQSHASAMQSAGANVNAEREAAARAYALARTRAAGGAADPEGLAVAGFGEQARLYLGDGNVLCSWIDLVNSTACTATIKPAGFKQAAHLYAEQAARGSDIGLQSLRYIASWILNDRTAVARVVDDPLMQRLLVAYALARVGDIVNDDPASGAYYGADGYDSRMGYADAARGGKGVKPNRLLEALVAALQARGIATIAGGDRLAALAYRVGRYDLAQALVDRQQSALSSWVKAKLALRRGDTAGAAQAYADAAKAFPRVDASIEPAGAELLKAEQGVLTLSRGQYVEALDQLYLATTGSYRENVNANTFFGQYTNDMLYVAERVVTTDELKNYIDAHLPATPSAKPANAASLTDAQYQQWQGQHPALMADRVRMLLARRLVREDRVKEALPYFPEDDDARFIDRAGNSAYYGNANGAGITQTALPLRRTARDYGDAVDDGRRAWRSVSRAEGWYRAATLARQRGMEIMGYEQGPDFAEYDGNYEGGAGRTPTADGGQDQSAPGKAQQIADTPGARAAAELAGPFVTEGERTRYAASEARPNQRYHYRDVAADYINLAADLLPARSQAFAAVLCQGAGFVYYDERVKTFYARYVREGAAVPFAENFGAACEQPDFRAAARFPYVQAWRKLLRWTHAHRRIALAAGGLLLVAAAGAGVWLRQRKLRRTRESNVPS